VIIVCIMWCGLGWVGLGGEHTNLIYGICFSSSPKHAKMKLLFFLQRKIKLHEDQINKK
jgi:hypothetical protein